VLVPGEEVGRIEALGVSRAVVVPQGVGGRIANDPPERVHEPVDYEAVLYELEPVGEGVALALEEGTEGQGSELVVRSPHTGRFWHRAAPSEPPMASEGDVLEDGHPVGLIEVMKTFTRVPYRAKDGLPERARMTRLLVGDGAEVVEGEALVEVEPA
jgi:acetyl-CoA carboxylase biotin carboxyl carrier protein